MPFLWNCAATAAGINRSSVYSADIIISAYLPKAKGGEQLFPVVSPIPPPDAETPRDECPGALRLATTSTASLKNASIFSKRCRPLHRTSSGQSPHRSSRPDGQASLRSLAPPLPNKPASLGFVWVPSSHVCGLSSVFSEAHVPGKNRSNLIPSSADDGTLRGSYTKSEAFLSVR